MYISAVDSIVLLQFLQWTTGSARHQSFNAGFNSIEKRLGSEKRLIRDLMKDYDKYARPRLSVNQPITVLVDLIVIQFEDLNEKKQVLHTNSWIRMSWNDIYLKWNSTTYNISKIMLPVKQIWMPDLVIENSADTVHGSFRGDSVAIIWSNGDVYIVFGEHISTLCSLDLTYYPFDEQNCTIKISNWLSGDELVRTRNHFSNIDFAGYQESGQWSVKNSEVYISKTASTLHTYLVFPAVEYHVQLSRKPFYHTMYMIMPSFVLSLIALLMFCLPPESGEKVSLGITVFLAFSVLMFSLSDDLPESSDTFPIIGFYLMFVMNSTAIWLLITVAILNVHHHDKIKHPPSWLQSLALKAMAKFMCMKFVFSQNREDNDLLKCENNIASLDSNKNKTNDWILIARVFDRLCLILFVFVDLLAFIVLMCHYPQPITVHPRNFQRNEVMWNLTDF